MEGEIVKMGPQGWEASRRGQRTTDGKAVISPMRSFEHNALDVKPTVLGVQTPEATPPQAPGELIVDLRDIPKLPKITW